jgi:hypothetical protein
MLFSNPIRLKRACHFNYAAFLFCILRILRIKGTLSILRTSMTEHNMAHFLVLCVPEVGLVFDLDKSQTLPILLCGLKYGE